MSGRVRVSAKGHCNLTGVRTADHEFYFGYEDPDGTIHLVPAVLVPATQVSTPAAGHALVERLAEEFRGEPYRKNPWKDAGDTP